MKEILTYTPLDLRAALRQAWEESATFRKKNGVYPRMRLGLLLWRVKRERLHKLWGYQSLSKYFDAELVGLTLMTANFYAFAAHRLWKFFGYAPDELEQFDRIDQNRLRRCISLADTRDDFERYLQAGRGVFRSNGRYTLTITDHQQISWPRKKFTFSGQSFRLIDRLLSHISNCLAIETEPSLHQEQALTILALTYEVLINHVPRDVKRLEAALRQELARYDLPVEAAQLANMQFHRIRKQAKRTLDIQAIARALVQSDVQ